jgi:outer membrane beta-barrel protein
MCQIFLPKQLFAAELNPDAIRGNAHDKEVTVVQNTYFTKSLRPQIGLVSGRFLEEAYTKTTYLGTRVSLFPTEWIGLEFHSSSTKVQDSADRIALNSLKYCRQNENCTDPATRTLISPDPEINPVSKIAEFSLIAVPFYGKINIANLMIVYSDIFAVAGIGRLTTDQGEKKSLIWGFGQRFYLNQYLSLQVDFRQRRWQESRAGLESQHSVWCLDMGLGAFLWK